MIEPELISTLGFPVCVCLYLLYERTRTTEKLKEVIQKNTEAIQQLKLTIEYYMKE